MQICKYASMQVVYVTDTCFFTLAIVEERKQCGCFQYLQYDTCFKQIITCKKIDSFRSCCTSRNFYFNVRPYRKFAQVLFTVIVCEVKQICYCYLLSVIAQMSGCSYFITLYNCTLVTLVIHCRQMYTLQTVVHHAVS